MIHLYKKYNSVHLTVLDIEKKETVSHFHLKFTDMANILCKFNNPSCVFLECNSYIFQSHSLSLSHYISPLSSFSFLLKKVTDKEEIKKVKFSFAFY